ncbi:MAG: adenosylmethionine--8-amino-7-oxononanoate transaminase [Gammaproteobacteria bacterium]|nr:adenosylmethionine--8-amino-7-oxononanoate transaminase [Gammaproteobacteria bacterium]
MNNKDKLKFDRDHIWHPYSSMSKPSQIHEVISAEGVRLTLSDGREVIDGMSSWWSTIHGYNHPRLNQAVSEQLSKMSHVMFGGLTHQPAIDLAKKLIDLTAEPLQHVFFADSGSVAVEVAIKMAMQYWFAQGQADKNKLLTIRNGYHGDTFGAMAVCDPINGMHTMFEPLLPKHIFAPAPTCQTDADWDDADIAQFKSLIATHHQHIAAVIVEPLVQGAGGMRFYCPDYLRQVRSLCDHYDVLLILDEIATGFGRTGTMFAYEQADICPDILCVGKALTGGYMTLAATLCTHKVVAGIGADGSGVLMHGPTFMANPLACAVANESINLLLESDWQSNVALIERALKQQLMPYLQLDLVKQVRVKGAIGVVELHDTLDHYMDWLPGFIIEQGVWIRPFRNLIYIMPPFIIKDDDLAMLTRAIGIIIQKLSSLSQ